MFSRCEPLGKRGIRRQRLDRVFYLAVRWVYHGANQKAGLLIGIDFDGVGGGDCLLDTHWCANYSAK